MSLDLRVLLHILPQLPTDPGLQCTRRRGAVSCPRNEELFPLVGQALICARIQTGSPLHFRYVGRRETCRRVAASTGRTGLRDGASISRQDARSAYFFTARLDCDANEEEGREGGLVALDLGPEIPFVIHTVSGYRRSGKVGTHPGLEIWI